MSSHNSNPGEVIDRAYEIIRKTYHEITSLKNDIADIIQEIDSRYEFKEEYSYGPHHLRLKEYQVYLYMNVEEDSDVKNYIGIIVLFSTKDRKYKKISSLPGPEIWFCKIDIENNDGNVRWWDLANMLSIDDRQYYPNREIIIGGHINTYSYEDEETSERWTGQVIGYPITQIINREFIKNNILEKIVF